MRKWWLGEEWLRFLGIDLAWGEVRETGVCLVEDGLVMDSGIRGSQAEIVAWASSYTSSSCIVAIDAPLIVTNPSGQRPCETLLAKCFGQYGAGPHSSNLRIASFAKGIRGAQVASALQLGIDPMIGKQQPVRVAIEVFPHSALVALFSLTQSLKYKGKAGRSIVERQEAFGKLIECLESLINRDPPIKVASCRRWEVLQHTTSLTNASAMDRLEDELDAYVCAYVALYYWTHGLERCRVVGDLRDGYIVTPVNEQQARCIDRLSGGSAPTVDQVG
jgi:predicted RNase H-like nuclease